jgi:hypothetical protein
MYPASAAVVGVRRDLTGWPDPGRHVAGEATVKTHISHLFDKLMATNRVQLAIVAFRAGLVE